MAETAQQVANCCASIGSGVVTSSAGWGGVALTTVVPLVVCVLAAVGAWTVEKQQARDDDGGEGGAWSMCPCFPNGGGGHRGGSGGEYAALRMDGVGEGQPGESSQQQGKGDARAP